MSGPDEHPVATLADLDPDSLCERAIDAGVVDEETSPDEVGVVVLTEPERTLLQGLLIEAYDNLNGTGERGRALVAKRLSERLSGLSRPEKRT